MDVGLQREREHGTFLLRQPLQPSPPHWSAGLAKKRAIAAYRLLRNPPKMVRASLALKLLLLAFMAAVFVLASNLDAFLYMNRYFWFRKARNATAFFFISLGHLSASAFATISGSNEKPQTDEIHFATVVILELVSGGLLVSTLAALLNEIQQLPPISRNARVKAVVVCLLVASLWIAVKHANPLSHAPRLTQLELLENYFQKSQFSNYIMVVLLETVGA